MRQNDFKPPKGAKRGRKRVGRGDGSGHGSYSGKGMKGQNSRSGGGVRPGFEGGQLPITKGLPRMRGFTNIFHKEYSVVNLDHLSKLRGDAEVTLERMVGTGLVKNLKRPVKVLGRGELESAIVVEAHRFSDTARKKIEAVGGTAREVR
jgi:large subunit ribosomal protein L15